MLAKKKLLLFIALVFLNIICSYASSATYESTHQNRNTFDIVIYGGTPAGFIAAIQAAQSGKTVALIEQSSLIGGIVVNGLGGTDIDNHKEFQNSLAVGGLSLEFYRRIAIHYGRLSEFESKLHKRVKDPSMWRFEPHVAEKIIKEWIEEHQISLFLNTRLKDGTRSVQKKGNIIQQIEMEDGNVFSAKVFIDATLEGDLLVASKVSMTWGRESNSLYGETKNGIQAETTHAQFEVKVDPYIQQGNPSSGVIPTIQDELFGTPGNGDKSIQAYCFRMCLTQIDSNRIPFTKPENYDRNEYEIYLRYLKSGGELYTPGVGIPKGKTDLGAWHDLSHNLYGMNHGYPDGDYETRKNIFNQHKTFTQGLFYFLANDPEVGSLDPLLQKNWQNWGLCKDEFADNEGWPRQFYVRDARRMVSDYVITEHHTNLENPLIAEDPVAVAFWPPDLHSARRIVKDGFAYNEGFVFGGNTWRPFGISYKALIPKKEECINLLTPTCLSSSHIAYGAIRIEFTYMALGQACSIAASLAIDNNTSVQEVNYKALREKLIELKQVIDDSKVSLTSQ